MTLMPSSDNKAISKKIKSLVAEIAIMRYL